MRSHAKASSAGSTQRQASRLGCLFRGALAPRDASSGADGSGAGAPSSEPSEGAGNRARLFLAAAALGLTIAWTLLAVADANGAGGSSTIASYGVGAGQLQVPRGVAVDQANGDVYVGDASNERIDVFDAAGSFVRAFGWGVADGSNEFQTCTTICRAGIQGSGPGQFFTPFGVAVDPGTHDVYAVDRLNRRIQKFDSEGNFILMFGGDVASSGSGNTGGNEQQRVTVKATKGTFSLRPTTATGSGKTTSGSDTVSEVSNTLGAFHVGDAITGTGIPANTTITAVGPGTLTLSASATATGAPELTSTENTGATGTGNTISGSSEITGLITRTGQFAVGKTITGTGIPANTTITAVGPGTLTLSASATATGANVVLTATDIPYNASAAELRATLEALPGIGASGVSVSGGPGNATGSTPYTVTFSGGALRGNDVAQMTSSAAGLSEGTKTVAVATTVAGGGPEICKPGSGDVCKQGTTTGTANGQFSAWPGGDFIDVGPGGVVYVGDRARVQMFEPDGTWKGNVSLSALSASGEVTALAVDGAGNVYLKDSGASGVRKFELSGGSYVQSSTQFDAGSTSVRAIALGAAGEVFVLDSNGEYHVREYAPSGAQTARFGDGVVEASEGLAFDEAGERLLASDAGRGEIAILTPPPPGPLLLEGSGYRSVSATTAMTVHAKINPEGAPTTFHVEYGATDGYGAATAESAPIGEGFESEEVSVRLTGLQPGTTYHYRFVATNANGAATGPDETLKTYALGQFALPDARVFEQVSPPDKEGGEVQLSGAPVANLSFSPVQASPEGEAITFPAVIAFGEAQSAPGASQYLSRRGAGGWSTENISPPDREGYTRDPLRGFSPDLAHAAVIQSEPILAPGAAEGFENLYLRDNLTGALRTVTAVVPRVVAGGEYCVAFAGASAGFGHVLFYANGALTPDAPEAPGRSLYEWSEAGGLRLVSVLPDDTPALEGGFGAGGGLGCGPPGRPILRHAISDDGSRIFWTRRGGGLRELFVREDGTRTVHLSNKLFRAASADGSKVFFGDLNLERYDLETEELTNLAPKPAGLIEEVNVRGLLGASEDGSYVYFVANGRLAEGATRERPNLYLWHEDPATHEATLAFIATLAETDGSDWAEDPESQTARVTPDGRHLAFLSINGLAGNHTADPSSGEPHSQIYLYDAPSGSLVCASCSPTGAAPTGPSSVPTWSTPYEQPRYLSDHGDRLLFQSRDAISLHDTNGRQDVYMWERQGSGNCTAASAEFSESSGSCVFAVTPGTSGEDSYLVDASADGHDVFVSTRQQLAPQDEDQAYDLYDARVGGGFPPPPLPPSPCLGENCRPGIAAPQTASPGSAAFSGRGNVRRHRRCRAPGSHSRRAGGAAKRARQTRHGARRCRRSHRGPGR